MDRDLLDAVILRETFAEVITALTPNEVVVASLRLEGLDDTQIGEMLGLDHSTISRRMANAQRRIARQGPEAAHLVSGRKLRRGPRPSTARPLERGWLCDWSQPDEDPP